MQIHITTEDQMSNAEFHELMMILDRVERNQVNTQPKRYLTIKDVSNSTSLSQSTIRRAIKKGELKCSKKLGKLLFKVEWIDNWLGEK